MTLTAPARHSLGDVLTGLPRADQAADHRTLARHDDPHDGRRRERRPRSVVDGGDALRWHARRGGREHVQHGDRPRHRRDHGAHQAPSTRDRCHVGARRHVVRGRARSPRLRRARALGEPTLRVARDVRDRLLRLHLHAVVEASQQAEHRDRRRGRCGAGADRLGRGHQLTHVDARCCCSS